jgi:hypothetical protein
MPHNTHVKVYVRTGAIKSNYTSPVTLPTIIAEAGKARHMCDEVVCKGESVVVQGESGVSPAVWVEHRGDVRGYLEGKMVFLIITTEKERP